jgi:hypothetical protein
MLTVRKRGMLIRIHIEAYVAYGCYHGPYGLGEQGDGFEMKL